MGRVDLHSEEGGTVDQHCRVLFSSDKSVSWLMQFETRRIQVSVENRCLSFNLKTSIQMI